MKTTKLFFAMAIAASLAACTKEILVEPEKAVDSFDEIKGAKVLADEFVVNPTLETKVYAEGGQGYWEKDDVAGVAWFVAGDVTAAQSKAKLADVGETAYANHKLVHDGDIFRSNSNVYEGWHVAYHPYVSMPRPAQLKGIVVNPQMTDKIDGSREEYAVEQLENMPYFSVAHRILEADVIEGVVQKDMPIMPIANVVRPKFTVAADILEEEALKNLQIASITLTVKEAVFMNTLDVNPKYFPSELDKVAKSFDYAETDAAFTGKYTKSVTTTLSEDLIAQSSLKESGNLNFRAFIAPVPDGTDLPYAGTSVKVTLVGGSYFNISYDSKAAEDDVNRVAIEKFVDLLNGKYISSDKTYSFQGLEATPFGLNFELRKANFVTSYNIKNHNDWVTSVNLAKALGKDNVTFSLEKDANLVFPNGDMYVGADAEGNGALNITVKAKNTSDKTFIQFEGTTTWAPSVVMSDPTKNLASIKVNENARLTFNNNLYVYAVENNGTIIINGNSALSTRNGIANYGTIEVTSGAKMTNNVNKEGSKVLYTAEGNETATVIDNLISNVQSTLTNIVVKNDWTVEGAANWTGVAVELNNADVTFAAGANFDSITVTGESTITGNVTGDVFVLEGATLAVDGDIYGNVNVYGNATINASKINGNLIVTQRAKEGEAKPSVTLQSPYDVMSIANINNYATLNVKTDVYAANVETGPDSYTEIKTGFTLYYSGTKVQDGTVKGKLEYGEITPGTGFEKVGDNYFVNETAGLQNALAALTDKDENPVIVLQAPVNLTPKSLGGVEENKVITIDANNNEITFVEVDTDQSVIKVADGVKLVINDATINRTPLPNEREDAIAFGKTHTEELIFDCEVEFNNVVINNNMQLRKDAVLNDVDINPTLDVYAIYTPNFGQTITLNDCNIKSAGRGIKICEVGFDALGYEEGKVTYYINNTTFDTKKKAAVLVRSAEGADIYWNVNNDITNVTAETKLPVWLDAEAPSSYANAVNVYMVDGDNDPELDNTLRGFEN